MRGLFAVYRKELADQLSSRRFIILFILICLAGVSSIYTAAQSIRSQVADAQGVFLLLFTTSDGALPPFFTFIGFLGPLLGLALAFDSINGERNRGTLSRLLAQPIYRDSVINGKFLAGLTTVSVMLLSIVLVVSGLGVKIIGVTPTPEEVIRLLAFVVVCVLYIAFWMALATLFSLLLRQTATSALAGIAAWIFFTFFVTMIVNAISAALITVDDLDPNAALDALNLQQMFARISPNTLFSEATTAILMPDVPSIGPVLVRQMALRLPDPLPVGQSLMLVWPQIVGLLALTAICFAIAYVKFMREEIRAL